MRSDQWEAAVLLKRLVARYNMGTYTSPIPRDIATQYGREAVAIGERGEYAAPSGRMVDIRAQIEKAVQSTLSYPPDVSLNTTTIGQYDTAIEVANETTLSAAVRLLQQGFKSVALSFASATSPGGGFLQGARAQEEYLARSSCLYQCIRNNPMYAFHREAYDPLYTDYVLDWSTERHFIGPFERAFATALG